MSNERKKLEELMDRIESMHSMAWSNDGISSDIQNLYDDVQEIKKELKSDSNKEKYVWINTHTGEFSNSWNGKEHLSANLEQDKEHLKEASSSGWKLLKYNCINDKEFEFKNYFKLR